MRVTKCPICDRDPVISECRSMGNGLRRRLIRCPNYHSIIPDPHSGLNTFYFVYVGDGDDNQIFKLWNKAVERYLTNEREHGLKWWEKDFSPWTDDPHIER